MAEHPTKTPDATPSEHVEEAAPTRLQSFVIKHPRASRIVAIAGGITAVAGVAHVTRTVSARRHHLNEAADRSKEALREVAASVSPTDPEA